MWILFDRSSKNWTITNFRIKIKKFLERINVDIDIDLFIIVRDNKHFVFIKNDKWNMMWIFCCKHKFEIFKIVMNFKIWIKLQCDKKIKIIRVDEKLQFNVFKNWFKKTKIQWKFFNSYTSNQNVIIERIMYTVMIFVLAVLKNMKFSKDLWNFIAKIVIYVKNKIITINENNDISIISYQKINNVMFNINNLRTFDCKIYTHVFKIIMRHKLNDRCWKNIYVEYEKNN